MKKQKSVLFVGHYINNRTHPGEVNKFREGDTEVVPNDALTVKEILNKSIQGMSIDQYKKHYQVLDEETQKLLSPMAKKGVDFQDRYEYIRTLERDIKILKGNHPTIKKALEEKQNEARRKLREQEVNKLRGIIQEELKNEASKSDQKPSNEPNNP